MFRCFKLLEMYDLKDKHQNSSKPVQRQILNTYTLSLKSGFKLEILVLVKIYTYSIYFLLNYSV